MDTPRAGIKKQSTEKCDGDTEHHPHGETDLQKQAQYQKHQHQTESGVFEQQVHAAFKQLAGIVPGGEFYARRQSYGFSLDVALDQLGNLGGLLFADPKDFDHGCRLAVKGGRGIGFGEGIPHPGNVAETDFGAVGVVDHDDIGVAGPEIATLLGTQKNLAAFGADGPAGQIQGCLAHPLGHLVQGKVVTTQLLLREFLWRFRRVAPHPDRPG